MNTPEGTEVDGLRAHEALSVHANQKDSMPANLSSKLGSDMSGLHSLLSKLPSIDRLITAPLLKETVNTFGLKLTSQVAKDLMTDIRQLLQNAHHTGDTLSQELMPSEVELSTLIHQSCVYKTDLKFKSVLNMTGTVIHTNLGRSVLADEAVLALVQAAKNPLNLEYDLNSGERGDRDYFVEELICEITGAQAATFVNNNAAAVLLSISALAYDREVIISRGELVEIGGAFRMPDVMQSAGAKMVEVGTTNRTHMGDYERAIGGRTSLLMKIHTSNYQVQGFTKSVNESELSVLSRKYKIPLATDLGSGSLIEMDKYGLPHEPTPQEMLKAGCNVVTFSGDKLLGGPQAGIIVGTSREIELIRRYPMKRALRLSKLPMVALEATLKLYLQPEKLVDHLPTLRWLTRPQSEIKQKAEQLLNSFIIALSPRYGVQIAPMMSQIGSGSLPVDTLPSFGLAITPNVDGSKGVGSALLRLSAALRTLPTPIIGRIERNQLFLDCRCIDSPELVCVQMTKLELC